MTTKKLYQLTLEELQKLFTAVSFSDESLDEFAAEFWRLFASEQKEEVRL